jgi:hypothetical protein
MSERMFTVTGFEDRIAISNCDHGIMELYYDVERAIKPIWETRWLKLFPGVPVYDIPTFHYNIKSVTEDMDCGRIPEAVTYEDWVKVIVEEFSANMVHGSLTKDVIWESN